MMILLKLQTEEVKIHELLESWSCDFSRRPGALC